MKNIITLFLLLFCLSAGAAQSATNVQRLTAFGIVDSMSSTDYVAVGVYSNGLDRLRGIPATSFFATAGSNTFLAITNFVKSQDQLTSNGVVTLILLTSNSLQTIDVALTNYILGVSNYFQGNSFARLQVQTNGTTVGQITNQNWNYGVTGFSVAATAVLGVDDSSENIKISNGVISQLIIASNTLFGTSAASGSNRVVVLSGTNSLVSMTSTNGTNFYAVNVDPVAITNILATTNYANQVASNRVVVLSGTNTSVALTSTNGTNFYTVSTPAFTRLELQTNATRLGLVTNINWSYGMTGSVSGATATLGVDDSAANNALSNSLTTTINVVSNFLATSSIDVKTNQTMLILQQTPVSGSQWYVGTNGTPTTNQARNGFEFNAFFQSLRMGSVDGGPHVNNMMGDGSNAWNNTNLGVCSVAFGSNGFAKADYSSVLGGNWNGIRTNARYSVIGGGVNNQIDTNASSSVIAGGGKNWIRTDSAGNPPFEGNATISGGSNNVISGAAIRNSTIAGGIDNLAQGSGYASIGGGSANQIFEDALYGTIGGGSVNRVGTSGGSASISQSSTVSGGQQNIIRGAYCVISGGRENGVFGNAGGAGGDYNFIGGGASNSVGIVNFPSKFCVIGGGHECDIQNEADYSVVGGGANNNVGASGTNTVIAGGRFNVTGGNKPFGMILGGERNTVTGKGSFAIGNTNTVSADFAGAIGNGLTVVDATMNMVANLSSFAKSYTISGSGNGNTNYTLQAIYPKMNLGSSNVNIVAVMQTTEGQSQRWRVAITNLSANNWGFSFPATTNRVKWQSWMYGTNAPSVITNNTVLVLDGESEGTNTLVEFKYFSPAL